MMATDVGTRATAELLAELDGMAVLSREALTRAGEAVKELHRRGVPVDLSRHPFGAYLERIAADTLASECVVAFAAKPALMTAIGKLPVARQRELAAPGATVPVVLGEGEEPTPLPVADVYPHFVSIVFVGDGVAPPEVQEQRLRKRRERADGGPARAAKRMERLMAEWQVTALTPMRAAELLVAAGLRPGGDL